MFGLWWQSGKAKSWASGKLSQTGKLWTHVTTLRAKQYMVAVPRPHFHY